MPVENFADRLIRAIQSKNAPCVVGLDTSLDLISPEILKEYGVSAASSRKEKCNAIVRYNRMVLDQVADLVPAVKPNSAFYERYGADGIFALEETCEYAKSKGLLTILDVKRGDIGPSSEAYARGLLSEETEEAKLFDSITLSAYLGEDSVEPFVNLCRDYGRGGFVMVKTSNRGSAVIQDLPVGNSTVCEKVAELVSKWSEATAGSSGYGAVGAVVGATWPDHAKKLRALMPKSYLLVPGFGAQGGDIETVKACFNRDKLGAIINSSRGITYPQKTGSSDAMAKQIRVACEKFVADVVAVLK